jgi:hypothetical protein
VVASKPRENRESVLSDKTGRPKMRRGTGYSSVKLRKVVGYGALRSRM